MNEKHKPKNNYNRNKSKKSNSSQSSKKSINTITSLEMVNIEKKEFKKLNKGSTFSRLYPVTYMSVKSSLEKIKKLQKAKALFRKALDQHLTKD